MSPEKREAMARALCISIKLDPDIIVHGEGWYLPKDFKGPAWQGYAYQVDAIMKAAEEYDSSK